jgi:hypothetical protein
MPAARRVVDAGADITDTDTVLDLARTAVSDEVARAAPCGCPECTIAASVYLVTVLALRLAAEQAQGSGDA